MKRRIALNPIDYLAAAFDDALRYAGQSGFNCVYVITLAGRVDRDRLVQAAERLGRRHPLTTSGLARPWYARRPTWTLRPERSIPVDVADTDTADAAAIGAGILNMRLAPCVDSPVQVFLRSRRAGGDVVVLKWSHVLSDARGGDFLMRELGRCYAGEYGDADEPKPLRPEELPPVGRRPLWRMRLRQGGDVFRLTGAAASARVRLRVVSMDEAESQRVREAGMRIAGFGRLPVFVLAQYFRVLGRDAVCAGRPDATLQTHWLVRLREGLPTDALAANEFGVLCIGCSAGETADIDSLVERLTREIITKLGQGENRGLWQTGRWLRYTFFPTLCRVNRHTRIFMRFGQMTTQFRYGGRLLGGDRTWGGIPLTGAFAATVCWPEKPVAISVSESAGRFHIGATWVEGTIPEDVADRLIVSLREELLAPSSAIRA